MSDDLQPITPADAVEMYLRERQSDLADASLQAHRYRLKHFIRWCEENSLENMNTLTGRHLHQYKLWRRDEGDLNRVTLKTQMDTLRVFIRFCERVDAVQTDLSEKVVSPSLADGENQREVMLDAADAKDIMDYLARFAYASFEHAVLAVLWHTGMRTGGVRALDLSDYDRGNDRLRLRHRPETGTPLKNGREGERLVALSSEISRLLEAWVEHHRHDVTDEYDRRPLFTTSWGRPAGATIREAVYRWTRPCEYTGNCPHGREIAKCEATNDAEKLASKCPDSVSPHAVRRGSITHHLTNDVPEKVVSDRMNVSQDVLDAHYDERSEEVKVEQRRGYLDNV